MTVSELPEPAQDEHSRAAVLTRADNTGLEKLSELTVYAIPLFRQGDLVQLVFLPVPAEEVSGEPGKSHVPQKLRDYAQKTQVKCSSMWQQWGQRDKGVRRRVHDMGQRQVENVSPESRLLTGVKRGTKQLTVYHPASISDEVINIQLAGIAASQGKAEYWKLSAACAALPVAFAVDTLVLIGLPPMLTGYTGYQSYKHFKGAAGASTLKKLGQASTPQQPLHAGLSSLPQQQHPNPAASSEQAYTGFVPQASELGNPSQYSDNTPGSYASQTDSRLAENYAQSNPGIPAPVQPSDSDPMTYQSMLDSLASAGNAAGPESAYNHVPYPDIATGGPAGQHSDQGFPPASTGVPSSISDGVPNNASHANNVPSPTVGIDFVAVPMLDNYVTRVEQHADGALSEEDILELCTSIGTPKLVKPLMELKQRQLRLAHKSKA